jgi:threonine/homoserine/homoserine lactone efflux protein
MSYRVGKKVGFGLGLLIFFSMLFFINKKLIHAVPWLSYPIYILAILLIYLIFVAISFAKKEEFSFAENVV